VCPPEPEPEPNLEKIMSHDLVILIRANEDAFATAPADVLERLGAAHAEFNRRSAGAGHPITAGAQLLPSSTARVVHAGTVTDGPYAELAEQIGGFYAVRTDDPDGFADLVAEIFTDDLSTYEIRTVAPREDMASLREQAAVEAGVVSEAAVTAGAS
jgi:hypothetical protein